MAKRNSWLALLAGSLLGAAVSTGYVYYLRPRMMRWGAEEEELYAVLPGDDLIANPRLTSTHAITIQAPPYRVWPWLVQMGQGRGGFYTYDWIENLGGLDIHSADRVLAMYQDLREGDVIPLAPNGFGMRVAHMEDNRALVLHGDTREAPVENAPVLRPGDYLASTWGFYLFETDTGATRLVERWKADWNPNLLNSLFYRIVLEPGAFIMERGMLEGIKDRAEGRITWAMGSADLPEEDRAAGLETGARVNDMDRPGDQYSGLP
jgi:hypothetical protein